MKVSEYAQISNLATAERYCNEMLKYETYMWFYIFSAIVGSDLMSDYS